MIYFKQLFILLILLNATSCFSSVKNVENKHEIQSCVEDNKWYLPSEGKSVAQPNLLLKKLTNKKVLLLGEHHDRVEHHRWQLQTIITLYAYNQNIKLGFEMFPRSVQPVLDKWIAGELDDKKFLEQVEWQKNWNYDPDFYLPIFHFARMNSIPMLALNVDRELVRNVKENGWENVAEADKQNVKDPAPMSEAYLKFMEDIFKQHVPDKENGEDKKSVSIRENPGFRRFIQGQQLWDASMAQMLAEHIDKDHFIVGIMGSGHMVSGFGVPEQLHAMNIHDFSMLVPWHDQFECSSLKAGFSDVVVGLATYAHSEEEKEKPRLGIYMEKHDKGVRIIRVVENSVAEHTGLRVDDVVVGMAGSSIKKMSDIINIVQNMILGTWLPISIDRQNETLDFVAKFPNIKHPN